MNDFGLLNEMLVLCGHNVSWINHDYLVSEREVTLTSCLIYQLLSVSIVLWEKYNLFFLTHSAIVILKTIVKVSLSPLHSFVCNH
jgi:hypothetical protein